MRSRAAKAGLLAAVIVLWPSLALGEDAGTFLRKIARTTGATYQQRQLVVYMGRPQSAAVVDLHVAPTGRFVRAQADADVTRVWLAPQHGLESGPRAAMEESAPPSVSLDLTGVMEKYDVQVEPPAELMGVEVVPLALVRREDGRLVERLWVDGDNGVLYRRELYGRGGSVLAMMTTIDMHWGSPVAPETYDGDPPSRVRAVATAEAPRRLAFGYRLVGAYALAAAGRPTTHWLYSDGLHAMSVFRTKGALRRPERSTAVQLGRTRGWAVSGPGTWTWEGAGSTWTIVAEEPQLDPRRLAAAFPQGSRSTLSKLGSWWSRGYRWLRDKV